MLLIEQNDGNVLQGGNFYLLAYPLHVMAKKVFYVKPVFAIMHYK